MTNVLPDDPQSTALIAVATLTVGILLYLYLYLSPSVTSGFKSRYGELQGNVAWVVLTKLAGFTLLGVIPALIVVFVFQQPLEQYGAGFSWSPFVIGWMVGGSILVLIINILHGRRAAHYGVYPLMRYEEWNTGRLLLSLVTSSLFIIGYEFMFRGFLLFALIPVTGVWLAVAINILIYSLAHIHKGLGETIGSIPFGILLCWITLESGNLWAITVIHLTLSLSSDLIALRANPDMRFVRHPAK
jgi:membrane protease YdiL (CAAX protease family)